MLFPLLSSVFRSRRSEGIKDLPYGLREEKHIRQDQSGHNSVVRLKTCRHCLSHTRYLPTEHHCAPSKSALS